MGKGWRVELSRLGDTKPVREIRVSAPNWIGALRAARQQWGEPAQVPPGASCAVAPDGAVTVMDGAMRRRFTLTEVTSSAATQHPLGQTVGFDERPQTRQPPDQTAPTSRSATTPIAPRNRAKTPARRSNNPTERADSHRQVGARAAASGPASVSPRSRAPGKSQPLHQTIAFEPEQRATPTPSQTDAALVAIAARQRRRQRFKTVGFDRSELPVSDAAATVADRPKATPPQGRRRDSRSGAPLPPPPAAARVTSGAQPPSAARVTSGAQPPSPAHRASVAQKGHEPALTLLLQRDEDPNADNPLAYRERAYCVDAATVVGDAEALLRMELRTLQAEMRSVSAGKFCSLAVFDHPWEVEPVAPPLVVLEWKDWKGEPEVDYPAALVARQPSGSAESTDGDDARLEIAFDALQGLSSITTAGAAMELAIAVAEEVVPSEAVSACLYDDDTGLLRFVAASGPGAAGRRGTAVPSHSGLIGIALAEADTTTVIGNVGMEPAFDARSDARPELGARNMLLRPLAMHRQPLGLLQLINRSGDADFSQADVNVINYVAERVAEAVAELRTRSLP